MNREQLHQGTIEALLQIEEKARKLKKAADISFALHEASSMPNSAALRTVVDALASRLRELDGITDEIMALARDWQQEPDAEEEGKSETITYSFGSGSEDKQHILDLLLPALQATRDLEDLQGLAYDKEAEAVTATFSSGGAKRANVACDSGIAMIRDVLEALK